MNYRTATASLPQDAAGVIFDLGSLYERLGQLTDRRHRRGRRYELALLVLLALMAKLAGQDTPGWPRGSNYEPTFS